MKKKLDGSQPALQPVSRPPLQSVNRPPLQPVNRQPLQQLSLNFTEVNHRQLVATHPVGPRKPTACSVGHRSLLPIQQAPDPSSNLSRPQVPPATPNRPQIPPATPSGPRRPTTCSVGPGKPPEPVTCSGGLSLVQEACHPFKKPVSHSVGLPVKQ